jgi:hypothetical protein
MFTPKVIFSCECFLISLLAAFDVEKPLVSLGHCCTMYRSDDDIFNSSIIVCIVIEAFLRGSKVNICRTCCKKRAAWTLRLQFALTQTGNMSKPNLSSRVQGMKFMQRAKEKQFLAEADKRSQVHV